MGELYQLMHKNDICGLLSIDPDTGSLTNYRSENREKEPYLGNATAKLMKQWWEARAVPASRKTTQEMIRKAGCSTTKKYLAKNLALSMTDSYWICPADLSLKWEQVNLYDNTSGRYRAKLPYHNTTSYDPNASLGGQMDKYWDTEQDPPVLAKTAYREYGQQALNEVLAAKIHAAQDSRFPFTDYWAKREKDNGITCFCKAFTSQGVELVPALEILNSGKSDNSVSLYDAYIDIAAKHGLDAELMREYMDYQTLTDFIISNTDRHLQNFGILRDSESLRFIGPAPLFDFGNSMFYSDDRIKPYKRHELLERKISAIHDKEEFMLKHIANRDIVRADLLPSPHDVKEFFTTWNMPEEKADLVAKSYGKKLELLHDFQKGKTISLYLEKKAYRQKTAFSR